MEKAITCSRCKTEKSHLEFYKEKNYWCKECYREYAIERKKKYPLRYQSYHETTRTKSFMIFARKKANAKQRQIDFSITKKEFIKWYSEQLLKCHYCGINQEDFPNSKDNQLLKRVNLSIDRVDNSKGYNLKNIVLCCNRCNSIKGSFFNYNEMKDIGENIVKKIWQKRGIDID
jgi:hypothetical protein